MTAPVDRAYVLIIPNFSMFKPALTAGVDEALTGVRTSVKKSTEEIQKTVEASRAATLKSTAIIGTAVGVGVVVALGLAVKAAGDFQASMVKLTTTAGETGTMTSGNLKLVADGVLKMAVDTATSQKQLSDGMYIIESAGFHGAEGLKVLRASAEGARAEQADLATVTNAVTSALMSYHMNANQSVTITNQMVAAVGHGKMTFEDFAGSLSTVLPVASAAGLSFAQIAGAEATMTNHGTSANEATQELANTIRALQAPNAQAVAEMQRMGLSSIDLAQHLGERGLTGTLGMITEAITKHMGPDGLVLIDTFKKSQAAASDAQKMIGAMPKSLQDLAQQFMNGSISLKQWHEGIKGLPVTQQVLAKQFAVLVTHSTGFNDLLKRGGPAAQTYSQALEKMLGGATGMNTALMLTGENLPAFTANVKAVGDAAGKTGDHVEGWDKVQQTFNFQLHAFIESIKASATAIGLGLLPVLTSMFKTVQNILGPITSWVMGHRELAASIIAIVGGIGLFIGMVLGLAKAAGALVEVMKILRIVTVAEDAALVANPIGIIIAAIALLVVGVIYAYTHFKTFRDVVNDALHVISVVATWTWNNILHPIFNSLVDIFKVVATVVTWLAYNVVEPAFHAISAIISFIWNNVIYPEFKGWQIIIQNVIAPVIMWFWHNIVENAFKAIAIIFQIMWALIRPVFEGWRIIIMDHVVPAILFLWHNAIEPAWHGMYDTIHGVWILVKMVFDAFASIIRDHVAPPFRSGVESIKAAWDLIREAAKTPINFVIDVIDKGIINPFNDIAKAFNVGTRLTPIQHLAEGGIAQHGLFRGIGGTTDDKNLIAVSDGEFWVNAQATRLWRPVLEWINSFGKRGSGPKTAYPGDGSFGVRAFAGGGIVGWLEDVGKSIWDAVSDPTKFIGNMVNRLLAGMPGGPQIADLLRGMAHKLLDALIHWVKHLGGGTTAAQAWVHAQAGKPYIWGGAGPQGYDCSGAVGAVWQLLHGVANPYQRIFSTMDLPGHWFPLGGEGGPLTAWWTNPGEPGVGGGPHGVGHMRGRVGNLDFESRGGDGFVVGSGVTSGQLFSHVQHYLNGGTVPGPLGQAHAAVVHGGERVLPPGPIDLSDETIDKLGRALAREINAIGRGMLRTARAA